MSCRKKCKQTETSQFFSCSLLSQRMFLELNQPLICFLEWLGWLSNHQQQLQLLSGQMMLCLIEIQLLKVFIGLLINAELEMIILIQFFDFPYLFFCFTFIYMIKPKYAFFLTHYIIGLDKLQNIRTAQFFLQHYSMKFDGIEVMKVWRVHYSIDHRMF